MELIRQDSVRIVDLAAKLDVSELTVRRDLLFFEQKNLIERFYGGAKLISAYSITHTDQNLANIKHAIARKAADLVDSGDTLFINTSSTALLTLKYLGSKEVTVITNNGNVLDYELQKNITIILSGGEVHSPKKSLTGDFAIQTISQIHVSKAILGCSGFSITGGITTSMHREVNVNQTMLNNCRGKRIVLADHTKIAQNASYSSGSIFDVDILITDENIDTLHMQDISRFKHLQTQIVSPYK